MSELVRLACRPEMLEVPLEKILPMRRFDDGLRKAAIRLKAWRTGVRIPTDFSRRLS